MSNIDDYYCAAGYYCYKGNYVEQPDQADGTATADPQDGTAYSTSTSASPIGGPCPINRQCPYIHVHQMECEDGFISLTEGLAQCEACSTGHYCDMQEDETVEIECITQSVCNGADKRQPICPSGTFMNEGD